MVPKKKRIPDSDRRRWPRLKPSEVPFLKAVTLNQGTEVQAIDISRGGMLLETEVSLRPQMKIYLRLVTNEGISKIEGIVIRSTITSLTGAPKYQSAIQFEQPLHMLDTVSQEPAVSESADKAQEEDFPETGEIQTFTPLLGELDEDSSVLTFITPETPAGLRDRLKFNDW